MPVFRSARILLNLTGDGDRGASAAVEGRQRGEGAAGAGRAGASDEAAWVAQTRAGDGRALERIFFAYYPALCAFAMRFVGSRDEAREVVQEVFARIWERRAGWHVQVSLKAYLYRAVRNQALNEVFRRRNRRTHEVQFNPGHEAMAAPRTADEMLAYHEMADAVNDAIRRLPERRRTAFVLHRQHGLTYEEIAQIMDISPRTVEVHIAQALRFLRDAIPEAAPRGGGGPC